MPREVDRSSGDSRSKMLPPDLKPRPPRLPFPAGAPRIYRTDHDGTLKERHRFAALVKPLLARGYEVTDVVVDADGTPAYVLDRIG